MALVVITGGARSGKSWAAEMLALTRQALGQGVRVLVWGRAESDEDPEFAERIARHRADRHPEFGTVEADADPALLEVIPEGELVIVECLGTLLGRLMEADWDRVAAGQGLPEADAEKLPEGFEELCERDLQAWLAALVSRQGDTIVVTNEVGDGVVPAYASGRLFRDLLGRANRTLVARADASYLCVAGRLVDLSALPSEARWPED